MRDIDQAAYDNAFPVTPTRPEALRQALDIRKFEIDLYWKRATYFWTFIGAVFAGYGAAQALSNENTREMLSVIASCLGVVFSFAWYCVNRGSKQWQENWEFHTDLLEDQVVGPLYKVVIQSRPPNGLRERIVHIIVGAGDFSVTKINQIVSVFVTGIWGILVWHSLPPFSMTSPINWLYVAVVGAAILAVILILALGRTSQKDRTGIGTMRSSTVSGGGNASITSRSRADVPNGGAPLNAAVRPTRSADG
jgi:hypothetical protein